LMSHCPPHERPQDGRENIHRLQLSLSRPWRACQKDHHRQQPNSTQRVHGEPILCRLNEMRACGSRVARDARAKPRPRCRRRPNRTESEESGQTPQ
jgi:hypothetical protein